MSEANLSRRLTQKIKPLMDSWHRIENRVAVGTPDVWFGVGHFGGWVELKHVADYPKMPTTPIRFKHFNIDQVNTLEEFGRAQGRVWILVQVASDHWLFRWDAARMLQLEQALPWWEMHARARWIGRLDYQNLSETLRMRR